MVNRSASTWHGCDRSVNPLITGHRRRSGPALGELVAEGAHHDRVAVAAEDPRRVAERLAAADLGPLRRQVDRVAAELEHADLERDAGARRRLLEDHAERAPASGACSSRARAAPSARPPSA